MAARVWIALGLIVLAAAARLIPHAPNFTPILAMALLSGAVFRQRLSALLIPVGALFLSDLALGIHDQMISVYGSVLLVAFLGFALSERRGAVRVATFSVVSSLLFFAITNFAVWLSSGMYAHTTEGLLTCYTLALPFLRNGLIGDLVYSGVLFGAWALATNLLTSKQTARADQAA